MSKEYLEAIERVGNNLEHHYPEKIRDFNISKQALQRLEAIENAKPSEALESVDYIEKKLSGLRYECERTKNHRCDDLFIQEHIFTTIKQALIKAQEQEKALKELIKLINHLEATFNREGVSSDTNILGTIIKDYFYNNASDLLKEMMSNE